VSFDGTDDNLTLGSQLISTGDEWDIFVVAENADVSKADSYILSQWDSAFSNRTIFMWHHSDWKLSAFNSPSEPRATTAMMDNTPYILGSSYDGTNMALSIDGIEEASVNAGAKTLSNLDFIIWSSAISSRYWTGDIAEVLVFKRKLTDFEADQVVDYLNTKWWL